ncbi:MAG TPA: D-aminoacyl-tRNA deacylase [Patescibacteria group bacterium]|nr:D-aminoacyl-tRNA deacylase [Patescibacteria group bacterium]
MRCVVQRVLKAKVRVEGKITGEIEEGLLVLVGITHTDTSETLQWMSDKLLKLRIFEDEEGKMNRSVTDICGGVLFVSQFTLYGELKKGTRPSFTDAARSEIAEPLYNDMITLLKKESSVNIQTGIFGAMMDVELVNSGPVTIILER